MVESMTGYGAHTVASKNYQITVELKSLNSKFIEHNLKIPRSYMKNEIALRNFLTTKLRRGKISGSLSIEILNPDKHNLRINTALVAAYAKELNALGKTTGISEKPSLEFLLSLPDAMMGEDGVADEEEWKMIDEAFRVATSELLKSRIHEGKTLGDDMKRSCLEIRELLKVVIERLPDRTKLIRSRVEATAKELKDAISHDQNRFEQELIYYIERLDINEEIVRLQKHIDYFIELLDDKNSNGKQLGFVAQEMGREINTIGSKANDATMQIAVVKMKEELERIKEQGFNIV